MKTINLFVNSFPKTSETFIYNKVLMLLKNNFKVNVITYKIDFTSKLEIKDLYKYDFFQVIINPIKSRFDVTLICKSILSKEFWKMLFTYKGNLKKSYKEFLLKFTLKMFSPDIIHFEFSGIGFQYLHLFDEFKNITLVSSFRGAAENITPLINSKRRLEFPSYLQKIHICHCVSKKMAYNLSKYGLEKNKEFINYPSIDINKFKFNNDYEFNTRNTIKILSVGRLHWKKGIDISLLALSKLKNKGFKFTYTLVGEGVEYEKLKFLTSHFDLDNEVKFIGYKNPQEVSDLLKVSQLFLLPSFSEGLANSALEAMSCGVPVISAKAGGLEEAIINKESGLLFNVGDVEDLYSKLVSVFELSYDLNTMRENARKTVETKFDLRIQSERFKELYKKI